MSNSTQEISVTFDGDFTASRGESFTLTLEQPDIGPSTLSEISYAQGIEDERARIRTELIDWLIGDIDPKDAGIINSRRIVDEIDRICPKE